MAVILNGLAETNSEFVTSECLRCFVVLYDPVALPIFCSEIAIYLCFAGHICPAALYTVAIYVPHYVFVPLETFSCQTGIRNPAFRTLKVRPNVRNGYKTQNLKSRCVIEANDDAKSSDLLRQPNVKHSIYCVLKEKIGNKLQICPYGVSSE
jgi:hypothetical protein